MDALHTLAIAAVQLQNNNFDAAAKLLVEASTKPDLVRAVRILLKAAANESAAEPMPAEDAPVETPAPTTKVAEGNPDDLDPNSVPEITQLDQTPIDATSEDNEEINPMDEERLAEDDVVIPEDDEEDSDIAEEPAQPKELPINDTASPNEVEENSVVKAEDSIQREASESAPKTEPGVQASIAASMRLFAKVYRSKVV